MTDTQGREKRNIFAAVYVDIPKQLKSSYGNLLVSNRTFETYVNSIQDAKK